MLKALAKSIPQLSLVFAKHYGGPERQLDGEMDGQRRMDGEMDGQRDEWMDDGLQRCKGASKNVHLPEGAVNVQRIFSSSNSQNQGCISRMIFAETCLPSCLCLKG